VSEATARVQGRTSGTAVERRAFVRFAAEAEAVCRSVRALAGSGWPGRAVNISAGGIGLVLRHCFKRGVSLAIELPDTPPARRRILLARVRHASAQRDGTWFIGCAFIEELSEEELQTLLQEARCQ